MRKFISVLFMCLCLIFTGIGFYKYYPVMVIQEKVDALKEGRVEEDDKDPLQRHIDFDALFLVNPDLIAWIYIPGTSIDYPIFQGESDTEYLWKDINKRYNELGSLFVFADENKDFEYANPYIFGHTMPAFINFGELSMYGRDAQYRKERNKAYIYTPKKTFEVQLYSAFSCDFRDEIFTHNMSVGTEAYHERLSKYKDRNAFMDIPGIESDFNWDNVRTFTLSTCDGTVGTTQRFVTHWINTRTKYNL